MPDSRTTLTVEGVLDLARARQQANRLAEADALYRRILSHQPDCADALHMLGVLAAQSGRHDEAMNWVARAIAVKPVAEYYGNLGLISSALGKVDQSIGAYCKALELKPDYPEALSNLANVLRTQGRSAEAAAMCRRALEIRPDFAEAHSNLSNALRDLKKYDEALAAGREAIRLRPQYPEAHNNLANALSDLNRHEEAIAEYQVAITQAPYFLPAHNNLAGALYAVGRLDEAAAAARAALAIQYDYPIAHWTLAMILLMGGNFREGWQEYEWRWKVEELRPPQVLLPGKQWNGEDLTGQRILLFVEQGFGDLIQFVRLLPELSARGAKTILFCQPQITRLVKNTPGVDKVFALGSRDDVQFDYYSGLLSVPRLLDITMETIPRKVPYIFPDAADVEKWRQRMPSDGRLKIGLAWAGRGDNADDWRRSTSLSTFAPLAEIPGIWFCSLQKTDRAEQAQSPPPGMDLVDWTGELIDFADTAALIANLDLVITVDSAMGHLAGAMGKTVWVLLSSFPDWRWLRERSDCPWYPTMQLFRQPKLFDYQTSMLQIAQALKCRMQEKT